VGSEMCIRDSVYTVPIGVKSISVSEEGGNKVKYTWICFVVGLRGGLS